MGLLGYHIDGLELAGNVAIKAQVQRTRANYNLVMDDKQYARDIYPFCRKGMIYRAYDPFAETGMKSDFDNDFWQRHSPAKVAQWMQDNLSDIQALGDNVYLTAGNNEPSSNPANRRALAHWFSELMHETYKRGIHLAVGEIAVAKTFEQAEIEAGVWDEFINTLWQYRNWHILTVHEYSTGVLQANFLPDYPRNLLDKSIADKSRWVTLIPDSGGYHIARWYWLQNRAKQLGKPITRVVYTECFFDYMEDDNPNGKWLKEVLRPKFNYGVFEGLKGWEGHKPYWQWLLDSNDDLLWQQFMFDQVAAIAKALAPEVEGFCLFGLNPDWYFNEGVDLSRSGVAHFRHLVETKPVTRGTIPPAVMPDPASVTMLPKLIKGTNGVKNVRRQPTINSDIVGTIPYPDAIQVSISDKTYWHTDGYDWYFVILPNGTSGFVASQVVSVTPVTSEFPLSAIEKQLISAYRVNDVAAILAILDNPYLHILNNDESFVIDAYRDSAWATLLKHIAETM